MLIANSSLGTPTVSLAWKCLAPPRAEILVWFVLQGRFNTKERLARLNIIQTGDDSCPLCSGASEIVDHLFFGCLISWNLWMDCYAWWEFYWCCPNKPIPFLEAWSDVKLHGVEKKMWMTLYYVVIWSI